MESNYAQLCNNIRKDIIEMIFRGGSGHPGGSLSAVEILVYLYYQTMRIDPGNPRWAQRDLFILSKGHAAPLLYAVLSNRGFFSREEMLTFNQPGSNLQKHIDMHLVPGAELSTGSLAQGLSVAVGMALGVKNDAHGRRVFVLIGDGECQEGQIWEAAMFAAHSKLSNLCVFLDNNRCQSYDFVDSICRLGPITDKWTAFGWNVQKINGHDMNQIRQALKKAGTEPHKPSLIIAETIKGRGVSFMENNPDWHARGLTQEEYVQAMADLNRSIGIGDARP
jgi:transketolase